MIGCEMKNIEEQLDRYIKLFRGRGDVYGSETGGCIKSPLTRAVFKEHLEGVQPIGVYPMVPLKDSWYTVWGCSDIDIEDMAGAFNLADALEAGGVHACVEKSRSKGYHVWVFASEPVLASDMRRMMLAAHQVADYPAREVNPKQETLTSTMQYGNYVRLPYPNYTDMSIPNRRMIHRDGSPMTMDVFLDTIEQCLNSPETIARLATYWKPPQVNLNMVTDHDESDNLKDIMKRCSSLAYVIWRDGPLPNNDRSRTLARLAHELVRSGLHPSECKLVIISADKRWGKYHLRPNMELEIDKLVQRVYTT
jgi:hypothetical protein